MIAGDKPLFWRMDLVDAMPGVSPRGRHGDPGFTVPRELYNELCELGWPIDDLTHVARTYGLAAAVLWLRWFAALLDEADAMGVQRGEGLER